MSEQEEQGIFLPTRRMFENKNTFSGSFGNLRFFLYPDVETMTILAKVWHGPLCIEKSTVEEEQEFPLSDDGLAALRAYLTARI